MKSGGIRRLSLKPVRQLTRAEFEARELNVFLMAEARENAAQQNYDAERDAREAAYVDGSQDDLTRDLDAITDIAAASLDDPGDAAA